jgi:hypothetical protein
MSEERRQILEMVSAGKVSIQEAEELLRALDTGAGPSASTEPQVKAKPKYIRVLVETSHGEGEKINVRIPMALLRAGVKLASLIPPIAQIKVNEALREHGMTVDLAALKPSDLEDLVEHLEDFTVDVDTVGEKVRVFCE